MFKECLKGSRCNGRPTEHGMNSFIIVNRDDDDEYVVITIKVLMLKE
jgi:hypothetical protein